MKKHLIFILLSFFVFSSCVSAPVQKKETRTVKSQHERAKSAFNELDDKPSIEEPIVEETPEPVVAPKKTTRPKIVEKASPPPKVSAAEEPIDFSSSRFLTAKGYGSSKPESIIHAKAELSNIFQAKISSDVTSKIKQVTDSIKGDSYTKSLQSQIQVVSDIELEGLQIGETQKERSEYVTTVGLDKIKAKEKWERDIKKVDTEIDILINKSNAARSKILKLLPLKKVLGLWVEREVTISRLRVIGFASEFERKDLKNILQTIADIKSEMLIDIDISGSQGPALRDKVAEILTDNGFKIGDFESKSDVSISGSVKIDEVKNNNPRFKFARATVSLNINDSNSKSQVGQVSENDRGAGLNYEEATHLSIKKVSEKVSDKLIQYFN
ncbi:MAG: hypothetical protein WC799_01330 [Desulfobacteraceae bacterium]|jgi:PBP1b-binding outer membrane lipoprotein LpoB